MLERQLKWMLFSVVVALTPIAFNWLRLVSRVAPGKEPALSDLLGRGELLLVAAGLTAGALGDLLGGDSRQRIWKLVIGAAAVIVLSACSYYFADVSAGFAKGEAIRTDVVSRTSIWMFVSAVITGAVCVGLGGSERDESR